MQHPFFEQLLGLWRGQCRTWFEPNKLADESTVEGRFESILGGRLVRHTYNGEIQGSPRTGEETIAFNSIVNQYQVAWFDDFHMSNGIMFSVGESREDGFFVKGEYEVGPDQPAWGWKTVYELASDDKLIITAFNITPEGQEAKAVETVFHRTDD